MSKKRHTFRARFVLALSVLLFAGVTMVPSAHADPYGYTGGDDPHRFPDSSDHWHCKASSVPASEYSNLNAAVDQLAGQTDLTAHHSSTCGSSTDVAWHFPEYGALGPFTVGLSFCVAHVYWGVCDQFWVSIDVAEIFVFALGMEGDVEADFNLNKNSTYRHELGHTAGLWHVQSGDLIPSMGCMVSAWIPSTEPNYLFYLAYGSHHVGHINAFV